MNMKELYSRLGDYRSIMEFNTPISSDALIHFEISNGTICSGYYDFWFRALREI